jgi:hypothetical protein
LKAENHIRKKKIDEKIVFLDQNEMKRKIKRSRDDSALNGFKSPGHGRKLSKLVSHFHWERVHCGGWVVREFSWWLVIRSNFVASLQAF